jgi:bacterial/archaeal transporter family-2 protein
MKIVLLLSTTGIGFLITCHVSMNAYVGMMTRNAYLANMLFWLVGAVLAVIMGVMNWDPHFVESLANIPGWFLLAGAIGACIAFFMNFTIPKLGIYNVTILAILGQLVTSMLFSHYGIFTQRIEPINMVKFFGAVLTFAGAILIVYGKIPFLHK